MAAISPLLHGRWTQQAKSDLSYRGSRYSRRHHRRGTDPLSHFPRSAAEKPCAYRPSIAAGLPWRRKDYDTAKADLKESFVWGYQDGAGNTPDDHPLRGPNQWPDFDPGMERHAMEYFHQAHNVAHHLMRGFAIGLDLDENFFLRTTDHPLSRASYVYPPHAGSRRRELRCRSSH